jgi:mono/diheme cytochrome c family protein
MLNSLRIALALLFFVSFTFPAWAQQEQAPPKQEQPSSEPEQTPSKPEQAPPKAEPPAHYTIPVEAAHRANPVKPTAESLALGKKMYVYDCAMCHGTNGDGKGDVAADMKTKVTDFSDPDSLKNMTDGELFYIIKNGKGEMPPEGPRVKTKELWNLVNYVRSFAKKKAPSEEKPQP